MATSSLRASLRTVTLSFLVTSLFAACADDHSLGEGARNVTPGDAGPGGSASGASGSGGSAGSGGTGGAVAGSDGSGGSAAGSSGNGGVAGDAGTDADDGGRCCPIDPLPGCCMNYGGARRAWGCSWSCDGMPLPSPLWRIENDEFGCPMWIEPPRVPGECCGCPPLDSGRD